MKKGIIFDLDQTLIDSSEIEHLRKARRWPDVYQNLSSTIVYDGVREMLSDLIELEYKIAVVTSSPFSYCSRALKFHKLPIEKIVGYHDTKLKKPYPDPILKAVRRLGLQADEVVSVGDAPADIQASKAAGVIAIAATWGAVDQKALNTAGADYIVSSIADLQLLLATL